MNYAFIKSPITNRYYDVNSLTGRYVLQNYVNQLGGAKKAVSCSSLKMKACKDHSDCDWRKNAKGKNTCQKKMTLKEKRKESSKTLLSSPKKSPKKSLDDLFEQNRSPKKSPKKSPTKKSPKKSPYKRKNDRDAIHGAHEGSIYDLDMSSFDDIRMQADSEAASCDRFPDKVNCNAMDHCTWNIKNKECRPRVTGSIYDARRNVKATRCEDYDETNCENMGCTWSPLMNVCMTHSNI